MRQQETHLNTSPRPLRPLAEEVYRCLVLDVWPGPAAVVDFGLATDEHYGALQDAVLNHGVMPEQLDDAMGDGAALTALIRPGSPYHGIRFSTPWDHIMKSLKGEVEVAAGERFSPGRMFATPLALERVTHDDIANAMRRHLAGDWGDLDDDDKAENDKAVLDGCRIVSSYRAASGERFWILTEADRSVTTVLLPEEY